MGREALEVLAERRYDGILSDLRMPAMSGEALYRRIEHRWPHLASRVVFVTANRPGEGFQSQYGTSSIPVLTKPFTRERLRDTIAQVIARNA
jgi:CheY-like chemotaxis protein